MKCFQNRHDYLPLKYPHAGVKYRLSSTNIRLPHAYICSKHEMAVGQFTRKRASAFSPTDNKNGFIIILTQ